MHLYLVRHAIAVPRDGEVYEDAERPLTPEGKAKFKRAVAGLAKLRVGFDLVVTSPWKRSAQTAALLAPLAPSQGKPRKTKRLAREPKLELLAELAEAPRVAAVGHEPWMGELCAWLVTGDAALGERFPFKKGGVAWLEGAPEPGGMVLRAIWTPRALRAAGR